MKGIFLFILITLSVSLQAQTADERMVGINGYVLVDGMDTLVGNITTDGFYVYHRKTRYDKATKYDLKKVKAYKIGDDILVRECMDVIQTNFLERTCGYVKLIMRGPVSLYVYQGRDLYSEEEYPNFYVRRNDTEPLFLVAKDNYHFRKEMAGFFYDDEEIKKKIESKEMKYDELMAIVSLYNERHPAQPAP